jgi:aspartyl protease family protein
VSDFPRRSGVALLTVAWIAIFGALFWWFTQWQRDADNPNRSLPGSGNEVALERNRSGHYVADGAINGIPVTFLVDTGATTIAVPMSLAKELGLALGGAVMLQTANGPKTAYLTRLASVRLGPIEQRDVAAVATDGMEGTGALLGMSFLGRLEFSQRGGRLLLKQPGA